MLVIGYDRVPILTQLFIYLKRIFVYGDFGIGVTMSEYRKIEGNDISSITAVEIIWSCHLFFLSAAKIPRPMPMGTKADVYV